MQFVQVKAARSPHTSQSGSAFGGGRAVAADEREDVATAAAEAAAAGGIGGTAAEAAAAGGVGVVRLAWREEAVDGDGPVAVVSFFSLLLRHVVVCGSDERKGACRGG